LSLSPLYSTQQLHSAHFGFDFLTDDFFLKRTGWHLPTALNQVTKLKSPASETGRHDTLLSSGKGVQFGAWPIVASAASSIDCETWLLARIDAATQIFRFTRPKPEEPLS
jgi:hypothetical protein